MTKQFKSFALFSCLATVWANALGFDIPNHSDLSKTAVEESILKDGSPLLRRMGATRSAYLSSQGKPLSIIELVQFGSAWEDDRNQVAQAFKHFFNPLNGRGLYTVQYGVPIEFGISSRRWAIESNGDRYQNIPVPPPQEFSYRLGRLHFFEALTKQSKADREKAWGLTFQIVGHVIHHVQDMAQPQHSRNDFHCDKEPCEITGLGGGVKLAYEKWNKMNQAAIKNQFGGYEPVYDAEKGGPFRRPEDFWSTGTGTNGIGIAQYTNRGFFTSGRNVGAAGFPHPVVNEQSYRSEAIQTLCREQQERGMESCPIGVTGNIKFYSTQVDDSLRPDQSGVNPRATSRSIYDEELKKRGLLILPGVTIPGAGGALGIEGFSMNRFTYDAMNSFVLKRAVGYSAGMINYFFRGNIDMIADPSQPGTYLIKNLGTEILSGTFALYYDDDEDFRKQVTSWELSIPAGGQVNVGTFTPPSVPKPKTPHEYMLVFHGDLGDETRTAYGVGGVTGALVNLSPGNTLYLAGLDAANQLVLMKTDSSGTKVLTGNEFHPLRNIFAFNRTVAEKVALAKQVEFNSDNSSYNVRAVTLSANGKAENSTAYVFHTNAPEPKPFVDYSESFNALTWQRTETVDGSKTQYRFRLLVSSESSATLGFARYDLSGETPQQVGTGSIALPMPPRTSISYLDATRGKVLVSQDGLRLIGFSGQSSSQPTERNYYELQLTIGNAISAQWVETTPRYRTRSTGEVTGYPRTLVSKSEIVTPYLECSSKQPLVLNLHLFRASWSEKGTYTLTDTFPFDVQKGRVLSWAKEDSSTGWMTLEETLEDALSGTGLFGPTGCEHYGNYQIHNHKRTTEDAVDRVIKFSIGNSSVSFSSRRKVPAFGFQYPILNELDVCTNCAIDERFEGMTSLSTGGWRPHSPTEIGPARFEFTGTSLVKPLTENVNEAIVADIENDVTKRVRFENRELRAPYVAEASPLGEVFVANSDFTVVVHRPRSGGMKVFEKPNSVVRLLGALWM